MNANDIKRQNTYQGQAAFTLVEVLASVCITAILFLALFSGISMGYDIIKYERENLRATQIMLSHMEGLRLCSWNNNQLFNTNIVPTTFTDYFYPVGLGGFSTNVVNYNGTMTVASNPAAISASYAPNMALVTVTVSWNDIHYGVTNYHTRSMSTYVAQYGIQNYVYSH